MFVGYQIEAKSLRIFGLFYVKAIYEKMQELY